MDLALPLVIVLQFPHDRHRHRGQRDEMGVLVRVGRLPFPELECLRPEPRVQDDGGPQRVQDFPAPLRGQEPQLELLPNERSPSGGEFILPDAPQALDPSSAATLAKYNST
jgi:hypothetical protein